MSNALPLQSPTRSPARSPARGAQEISCAGFALADGGALHCFVSDRAMDARRPPLLDGMPARRWRLRNHLDVAARAAGQQCWIVLLETGAPASIIRLAARDGGAVDIGAAPPRALAEAGAHLPPGWLPLIARFLPAEQALAALLRRDPPPTSLGDCNSHD